MCIRVRSKQCIGHVQSIEGADSPLQQEEQQIYVEQEGQQTDSLLQQEEQLMCTKMCRGVTHVGEQDQKQD